MTMNRFCIFKSLLNTNQYKKNTIGKKNAKSMELNNIICISYISEIQKEANVQDNL